MTARDLTGECKCGAPEGEFCECPRILLVTAKPKMPSIATLVSFAAELAERAEECEALADGDQLIYLRTARVMADGQIAAWQAYLNAGGKVVAG